MGAGLALSNMALSGCAKHLTGGSSKITPVPINPVRIGFVGVGGRGTHLYKILLGLDGVDLRAVCDIVPEKVARIQRLTKEAGQPEPVGYSRGEWDFKRLCESQDLDLVITATPWRWHTPVV